MENPFTLNPDEYTRDHSVLETYISDACYYIQKQTGDDYKDIDKWVRKSLRPDGEFPLDDPELLVLERDATGDRKARGDITFGQFLSETGKRKDLLSPSMVTYLHPKRKRSLLSIDIRENLRLRGKDKEDAKRAQMAGDMALYDFKQVMQTSRKVLVNSISGAHSSPHTPLYNHSAHPSLTSTCRCATTSANANNERFLSGNRHYWHYEVAVNNIVNIVNNTDTKVVQKTIDKYNLHYPTAEEVLAVIKRSTDCYWKHEPHFEHIRDLVESLSPTERATYLYTQDCYSLALYNGDLVRKVVMDFSTKAAEPVDDPDNWTEQLDEDLLMTISLICSAELEGRRLDVQKEKNPVMYGLFAATAKKFIGHLKEYSDLITTFWRTPHAPPSLANFTSSIRRNVVVSDTDSTIFTVQDWVKWMQGGLKFNEQANSIAAVMVYFSSQTLVHLLAKLSGNMGVVSEQIHQLAMKNEFMMESMLLTNKGKHYSARIVAKEGNVYKEPELDVKGVTLRNSKVPKHIMAEVKKFIDTAMDDLRDKQVININSYITKVANIEREIYNSIQKGETDYLTRARIMSRDTYTNPDSSNYFYYDLWEEVFADKYGHISDLPCQVVKISMDCTNITGLNDWLCKIEDRELAERLDVFLKQRKRRYLKMLLIPLEIVKSTAIPSEIILGSSIRTIIYTTMEAFYLLLESLGLYVVNKHNTRLMMDTH